MKKQFPAKRILIAIFAVAAMCAAAATLADEATLTADSMRYDPNTETIVATGNVHITNPDGEIFGDAGRGSTKGDDFEIRGNVRGHYKDKDGGIVSFSCAAATVVGPDNSNRVVTASGDVKLSKGKENLSAHVVAWHTGIERYSARGEVLGDFEAYSIDADAVSRDVEQFSATAVRKFYESNRKITMSASQANGTIKNNEVAEMTAEGNVVVTMPDREGVMTRATGNRGIYSLERGTIVLSGKASIRQTGRVLHSDSVVYFLDTGHIDAQGNPSVTFETNRKK
jgi:lipopolysaccharide transport protein LptA